MVFVTARPLRWMPSSGRVRRPARRRRSSRTARIVYDVAAGRIRELERHRRRGRARPVAAIRAALPGAAFAIEMRVRHRATSRRTTSRTTSRTAARPGRPRRCCPRVAVKVLVGATAPTRRSSATWSRRRSVTSATPTWSVDGLVEISAAGVTKAAALARVCDRLGVAAADVVAFGDMPNDLPMLAWAGTSYAMANAHPTVLAAADHVAPEPTTRTASPGAGWHLRPVICCDDSGAAPPVPTLLGALLAALVVLAAAVPAQAAKPHASRRCARRSPSSDSARPRWRSSPAPSPT